MAPKSKMPQSIDDIRARIEKAHAKGAPRPVVEQSRRALLAWVETAQRHGLGRRDILKRLASGEAATGIGLAVHDGIAQRTPALLEDAACRSGCAFCCILSGGDGGTITEAEARRVQAALADQAGEADGRSWHAKACAALDPATLACRAYEARPVLCRSFLSADAAACKENADGGSAAGAGLMGSHVTYLTALALTRSALNGLIRVRTYALDRLTAAAVEGTSTDDALSAAVQKPRALDDAVAGTGRAVAAAQRHQR